MNKKFEIVMVCKTAEEVIEKLATLGITEYEEDIEAICDGMSIDTWNSKQGDIEIRCYYE